LILYGENQAFFSSAACRFSSRKKIIKSEIAAKLFEIVLLSGSVVFQLFQRPA